MVADAQTFTSWCSKSVPDLGLRRDTGETLVAQVLGTAAGFATSVLIVRTFGASGKGVFSIASQVTAIVALLATVGTEQGLLYFVGRGDVPAYRPASLVRLAAVEILLVGSAALIVAVAVPDLLSSEVLGAYVLIVAGAILAQLGTFQLLALHRIRALNVLTIARSVLFLAAAGAAAALGGLTAVGVLMTGTLSGAMLVLVTNRVERVHAIRRRWFADWRAFARFGWRPQLSNLLQLGSYRLDLIIVGGVLGVAPAGVYSVALAIAEAAWLLSTSLSQVLLPRFLRQEELDRRALMFRSVRWSVALTLACSLVGAVLARPLIPLVFGSGFSKASDLILLMVPGVVSLSAAKPMASYQIAAGRPHVALYVTILSSLVTVPTYLVLIPTFGLTGGAIGSSVSYFTTAAIMFGFLRSRSTWSKRSPAS